MNHSEALQILGAAAGLALTAALPAQVTIARHAPTGYATTEGSAIGNLPFGSGSAVRTQYLYHGQVSPTGTMSSIRLRGNGGTVHPGVTDLDLEVLAGGSTVDPFSMDPVFANNRGPDFGVVFARKEIDLPPLTGQQSPQPFDIILPLDAPRARTSPHFLVEFVVHTPNFSAQNYNVDAAGNDIPKQVFTGTDCNIGPALVSATISPARSQVDFFLSGRSFFANGSGVLLLGSQALPAPVPLLGCNLYQDILFSLPVGLDAGGGAQVPMPVPTWSKRLQLQSQWFAVDPTLTVTGATFSTNTTIGGVDAVATNFSRSFSHAAGQVRAGAAVILELQ